MSSDQLTRDLRDELARVVAENPAPPATTTGAGALTRARALRTRRRAALATAVVGGVAAVALLPWSASTGPTPAPAIATPAPSGPTRSPSDRPETWRVTERCPATWLSCSGLPDAVDIDGATYRTFSAGSQPLGPRGHDIQLSVGTRGAGYRLLGGLVAPRPVPVGGFDLYVDGARVRHYADGRLRLLPKIRGHHRVRLSAVGPTTQTTRVVIGELLPVQ